jgi:uncharacterized protein (DUF736 family)
MAYEMKNYSGSMFKNDRKESDSHPDYKGSAMIAGVEMWMDAWIKKKEGAKAYMSFSFKPKDLKTEPRASIQRQKLTGDVDNDIPF